MFAVIRTNINAAQPLVSVIDFSHNSLKSKKSDRVD
jgi:hypothetical protein